MELWIQDMFYTKQPEIYNLQSVESTSVHWLMDRVRAYAGTHAMPVDQVQISFEQDGAYAELAGCTEEVEL